MSKIKEIVLSSMLLAILIILSRFISIKTDILVISLSFIPIMVPAIWLGYKYSMLIALCMIPILGKELGQTKDSLKSRGYKFKLNNLDLYIKPIMISILKKTDELEKTLIVKAYQE